MADVAQCLNGPVTAGDLVRVVLPTLCCGSRDGIGDVYRVLKIGRAEAECAYCGEWFDGELCQFRADGAGEPPSLVIRIDPPALPESVEDVREVIA